MMHTDGMGAGIHWYCHADREGKVRCCQYWPEVKSSREYGKFEVTTLSQHCHSSMIGSPSRDNYVSRTEWYKLCTLVEPFNVDWMSHCNLIYEYFFSLATMKSYNLISGYFSPSPP